MRLELPGQMASATTIATVTSVVVDDAKGCHAGQRSCGSIPPLSRPEEMPSDGRHSLLKPMQAM
ncbi:hypothetical protein FUT69_00600 [Xylella taiwanensis]|uniref:Uncharacterized protein n=1 Tax=Xylella taiwanensis TaxID=1444770 RepID=Z9JLV4_9GAMM|nr:hypothetical protein [Xylella taiwanensis]AXI83146.1 hypothetical protein AB672_03915 [Xylella taiwanensis]EWS78811.1 hypothetical protein AF72_04360 [Xylella taiwanensis]MCD8458604.1 hypothetical protein [Xylella taiwanensis]MCD8460738.1 hypothetical protein [Xylella taiwanensis]MCD8467199.1 hypothetical protein [Xylella taiwanensis]